MKRSELISSQRNKEQVEGTRRIEKRTRKEEKKKKKKKKKKTRKEACRKAQFVEKKREG